MTDSKVVAKVNEKEISQDDVMKFLNDIGPEVAMQFQSPEGMAKVIKELVNQELLYIDAKEEKFDEEEEFKAKLEENKNVLLKNYALNKVIQNVDVSEAELEKYFEEHKVYFNKPESVKASHILVKTEEESKDVLKKINEGMSFEEIAVEDSICPSKERWGDLGEFTRGQMVPEFEEVAFSMKDGEVSNPVKTQFGYHIIKLEHRSKEEERTFEEAKDEVNQQLLRLKQQEKYLKKIAELKEKNKVEIM